MISSATRIYAYDSPLEFLASELKRLKLEKKGFSLRAWAKQLGYENPSYLSDLIKGRRKLKVAVAGQIAESLGLDEKATRYFEMMVLIHHTKDAKEKRHLSRLLVSMRPKQMKNSTALTMEQFALIADWHNWAIAEMPRLRGFRSDPKFIADRLHNQVSKEAVAISIDLLTKNRILSRNEKGEITRTSDGPDFIEPDISKLAASHYHRQMGTKALEALGRQKGAEIDFQGSTFCIKKDNLPDLVRIVRECHQKLLALGAIEEGDEIYQFNSQLFRLS